MANLFKSIASLFVALITLLLNLTMPEPPENEPIENISNLGDICTDFELGNKLYVIDASTFATQDEKHLAVSIQGIVARTSPMIFIRHNDMSNEYLDMISKSGVELITADAEGKKWTTASLINEFKSYIADSGYVLYRESSKAEGLNAATNLASVYGWLPVPETLEDVAINAGLVLKEDYSDDDYNILFQEKLFNKYKSHFSKKAVISLKYSASGLRDLAIQQKFFLFYIDDDVDGNFFRKKVIEFADRNAPVLGWAKYEVAFVECASKIGNFVIPSDHAHNCSYLSSFDYEIPEQKHSETKLHTDPAKHYVAIVFSDGDNIQWIQNGYAEYYQKLKLDTKFPMTWSFPPLMQEFSPITANVVYGDATENDYFIAGVSGAGYMHPTEYPERHLNEYAAITASAMKKSNLHYVSILDATPKTGSAEKKLTQRLSYYANYDNIYGGILSLDPDRYEGGKGKVWFVNDKPFISYRLSLWHPNGRGAVTDQWLNEQAAIINSYPADINSINGYTVINVHPWSINIDRLEYFVNALDDDVELVTVDELMLMLETNIPHKTAEPDR